MMTLQELRQKYRPASPLEVLAKLASRFDDPELSHERPPMLTVQLTSGQSFRGHLLNAMMKPEPMFSFFLELKSDADGAADLVYVRGINIEAVTVWNVDDYNGILPEHE